MKVSGKGLGYAAACLPFFAMAVILKFFDVSALYGLLLGVAFLLIAVIGLFYPGNEKESPLENDDPAN